MKNLIILVALLITSSQSHALVVVEVGSLHVDKPAFLTLDKGDLLVSSFKLFGKDHVFKIKNISSFFKTGKSSLEVLTDKIVWPNEVKFINSNLFDSPGYLVASGFLLPTKNTGSLSFINSNTGAIKKLTEDKKGYFYHRAVVVGENIITARGKIPVRGKPDGELVIFKGSKFKETILAKGPDIHFRVFNAPNSGEVMIVTAEFSQKRLKLYWFEKDGSVSSRVIDDTLGAPFDLDFYDLNNDGQKDLLVTNHQGDKSASVFAYELPQDLKNQKWGRHTLLTGIETRQKGFNQASPGVAKAFSPLVKEEGLVKPWIIVSGDGSQRVHLLIPKEKDVFSWNYEEKIILDTKSTVGEPLVGDFDGDGLADFIVPAYDKSVLHFLSLKEYH